LGYRVRVLAGASAGGGLVPSRRAGTHASSLSPHAARVPFSVFASAASPGSGYLGTRPHLPHRAVRLGCRRYEAGNSMDSNQVGRSPGVLAAGPFSGLCRGNDFLRSGRARPRRTLSGRALDSRVRRRFASRIHRAPFPRGTGR
jgi:hypothetical protein